MKVGRILGRSRHPRRAITAGRPTDAMDGPDTPASRWYCSTANIFQPRGATLPGHRPVAPVVCRSPLSHGLWRNFLQKTPRKGLKRNLQKRQGPPCKNARTRPVPLFSFACARKTPPPTTRIAAAPALPGRIGAERNLRRSRRSLLTQLRLPERRKVAGICSAVHAGRHRFCTSSPPLRRPKGSGAATFGQPTSLRVGIAHCQVPVRRRATPEWSPPPRQIPPAGDVSMAWQRAWAAQLGGCWAGLAAAQLAWPFSPVFFKVL